MSPEPHSDQKDRKPRHGLFGTLRANLLTGLIVVAPSLLTAYIIWTGIGIIDDWVLPWVPERYQPSTYLGYNIRGFGVLFFLVFTVIVGWLTKGFVGRTLLGWGERVVDRMPIVRSLYNGVKQIAETVLSQTDSTFERACLVAYPRPGIWAIAFVSTKARGEIAVKVPPDEQMVSIFLPTTPNPTSGFLLYVPERDVIYLDMSVEDAAKLVISAGLVYPKKTSDGQVVAAVEA